MKLNYSETRKLIEFLLASTENSARSRLHQRLALFGISEAQLFQGIVDHCPFMKLSSDQWFKIISVLPNRILQSQLDLKKYLSPIHLAQLQQKGK